MAHLMVEIRQAARKALEDAGAKVLEFGMTGGCHQFALFSVPKGDKELQGKMYFAFTPGDRKFALQMRTRARRKVRKVRELLERG